MLRRVTFILVVPAVAAAAVGFGGGSGSSGFRASLTGEKEIGEGDGNGRGTFTARFEGRRLCYRLRFSGLDDPIAAHVHRGRSTQNGPVVVDLRPRFTGSGARARCVTVTAALRRSIRNAPARFYVNVHAEQFPDGAIRGQLRRR